VKFFEKLLLVPALFSICLPISAEPNTDTLKITVTGTRTERNVNDIPASITVIDLDDTRQSGVLDLKDLIKYEPGVSVFDPREINYRGSTSSGNVNIRGLSNNRILMQQDGIRLPSGFYAVGYDYSNGNTIDYYSLSTIDVLKGPGSVLYGSDALGGVVSFKSLKAKDILRENESFKIETPFDYNGSNRGISSAFRIAGNESESGISYITVISSSQSDEVTPSNAEDKYVNDADIKSKSLYFNIDKQIDSSNTIGFLINKYEKDTNGSRATENLAIWSPTNYYTSQTSEVKINKDRYVITWDYSSIDESSFLESIKAKAFYQDHHTADLWQEIQYVGDTRLVTSDYNLYDKSYGLDFQFGSSFNDHLITYGIDFSSTENKYTQDKYTNTFGVISHEVNNTSYPIKRSPDTDTNRLGFYVQDEFKYGKMDLIAGVRFDSYKLDASADSVYLNYCKSGSNTCPVKDLDTSNISPKIGFTYSLNNDLAFWSQYSRGFRAPSWWEMQASQINLTASDPYQSIPNSDLKPETSNSYEIGLRGEYEKYNFDLTGFYNNYNDFIETGVYKGVVVVQGIDVDTTTTDNVSKAQIWGIEFSNEYKFTPDKGGFSLIASAGYTYGQDKDDETPLNNIDPFKLISGIKYITKDNKLSGELISTYVGRTRRKDSVKGYWPKPYTNFDMLGKYKYTENLDITIGIYNLFDKTYYKSGNITSTQSSTGIEQFAEPGRHLKAGFKLTF